MTDRESARKDRLKASESGGGNDDPLHGIAAYLRQLGVRTEPELYAAAERQMHALRMVPSSSTQLLTRSRPARTAPSPVLADVPAHAPGAASPTAGNARKKREPNLLIRIIDALEQLEKSGVDTKKLPLNELYKQVKPWVGCDFSETTFYRARSEFNARKAAQTRKGARNHRGFLLKLCGRRAQVPPGY